MRLWRKIKILSLLAAVLLCLCACGSQNEPALGRDFKQISYYLEQLPSDPEKLAKSGCIVVSDRSEQHEKAVAEWDEFYKKVSGGKSGSVILALFANENDPVFYYIDCGADSCYIVADNRRNPYASGNRLCSEATGKYLLSFYDNSEDIEMRTVVLTDIGNLTLDNISKMVFSEEYDERWDQVYSLIIL